MQELLPGVFHWVTFHEGIREEVHSYYVCATDPAVVIDPRVPPEGLEWFAGRAPPGHCLLTNRHHYRHSPRFEQAFGATVWCHAAGLHEFRNGQAVRAFQHGDPLPGGWCALEVGVLCPEETAFYLPHAGGILAVGDALVRPGGRLGFVPDPLLGENPEAVKQGLRAVFLRHLEREFDHMLFAHGVPCVQGAKEALRTFLNSLRI